VHRLESYLREAEESSGALARLIAAAWSGRECVRPATDGYREAGAESFGRILDYCREEQNERLVCR
jgi:hypothetical protein